MERKRRLGSLSHQSAAARAIYSLPSLSPSLCDIPHSAVNLPASYPSSNLGHISTPPPPPGPWSLLALRPSLGLQIHDRDLRCDCQLIHSATQIKRVKGRRGDISQPRGPRAVSLHSLSPLTLRRRGSGAAGATLGRGGEEEEKRLMGKRGVVFGVARGAESAMALGFRS